MTKEELANLLNGREYGEEITEAEEKEAEASCLLVIFGGGDDLVELRGAIDEEFGAYNGVTFGLLDGGTVELYIDASRREELESLGMMSAYEARLASATKVEAVWGSKDAADDGFAWTFRTDAPHATFDILEGREEDGGNHYCRGIVIDLNGGGMIRKYRKKPVVVEAALVTEDNLPEVAAWCGGQVKEVALPKRCIDIQTLEGEMRADVGTYVIRGVQGEFYPCRADIFEATYEGVLS